MNKQTTRSNRGVQLRFSKATFMAGLLPSLVLMIGVQTGYAGSATWNLNPASNDWNTAANWTPNTVPDDPADIATFDVSNITDISVADEIDVAEVIFNPGASAFTISAPGTFNIFGAGITNNSGVAQNFVAPGLGASIHFYNSATAGGEDNVFTQTGPASGDLTEIAFHDTSSAGSATFISQGKAQAYSGIRFYDSATAGNGTFLLQASSSNYGLTSFYDYSKAGSATFVCEGGSSSKHNPGEIFFFNRSSAENATIILNAALDSSGAVGEVKFKAKSSAGNATIIANGASAQGAGGGYIQLFGTAMADNATFIVNGGTNGGDGGRLQFWFTSIGGTGQVKLSGNATLDLTHHNPGSVSIGSLTGTGLVLLGTTNLAVGTNNLTTQFSGTITDSAAFTKTGSGSLTLGGANDYDGGTFVQGKGTLFVNNVTGSGTGGGTVQVNSGVLGGNGIISGPVVIGNGVPGTARLMPGKSEHSPAVLTIGNTLSFNSDASYLWLLDTVRGIASSVTANGVTINSAALFSPTELQSSTLSAGTVFTVITNNGDAPISGRFSNLPDGGTLIVGNNTFQANYEGGDGNDLTLTVVQ